MRCAGTENNKQRYMKETTEESYKSLQARDAAAVEYLGARLLSKQLRASVVLLGFRAVFYRPPCTEREQHQ